MLFIAEIGLNHNGNFDLACELIKQAKWSGADVVKMQLGWKDNVGVGDLNCINKKILDNLFEWSRFIGIELVFSVFHEESFHMLKDYPIQRYKIASRTLRDNPKLVQKVVDEGKETIISLGMWDGKWLPEGSNTKYLWCKSLYPAYPWQIKDMPRQFEGTIYNGYSDHTMGIECALLAISRGANIIEKHFTLDKSDKTIRDHVLSATPEEFRNLVELGRSMSQYIRFGV